MPEQMENLSGKAPERETARKTDINKKLIINMRDLNHVMRALYEGRASQKSILIILNEVKRITQRDLTMRLGVQPGSASEILSKLENAGLISRTMSETDRRTANITLTEKGILAAQEAAEQRGRRHEEMFSCLSAGEKEELLTLLEKVNGDWTRRYGMTAEERRGGHHQCRHACVHDGGHGQNRCREHGHNNERGRDHDYDSEDMSEERHGHRQEHRRGDAYCGHAQDCQEHPIETEESDHGKVY